MLVVWLIVVGVAVELREKLYVAASCHVDVGNIPLPHMGSKHMLSDVAINGI